MINNNKIVPDDFISLFNLFSLSAVRFRSSFAESAINIIL